jgi:tryptophanyl-tRNA synthetase
MNGVTPTGDRPRVLSGMQPTADSLHLGNYLGALRQWVALQETHEVFYFVADLHSLTVDTDPEVRRRRTHITAAQFLAAGVDPDTSVLFVQSHLPEHAELTWILTCLTGYGEASRMTQFKDKSARAGAAGTNVGIFTYPILQAADILLYRPQLVPVGEDQRQHLELTRDLAQRFNTRFGEVFVVPEPYILEETAKIYDLQHVGDKMSGTVGGPGCLWLSDEPKVLEKKVRSAVTDTGREIVYDPERKPGVSNLLVIAASLSGEPIGSLEERFSGAGYGDLKKEVAGLVVDFAVPFQRRMAELMGDPASLDAVLRRGADRAREIAAPVLAAAKTAVGLLPPR